MKNKLMLFITFCLYSQITWGGLFDGCISMPWNYSPVSEEVLTSKLNNRNDTMVNCTDASLCIARVERSISKAQQVEIVRKFEYSESEGTSYTTEFLEKLSVDKNNTKLGFSLIDDVQRYSMSEILSNGSSILLFKRNQGDMNFFHTVFIQKTNDDRLFLYNHNNLEIDKAFFDSNIDFVMAGVSTRYEISNNYHILNQYLESNDFSIFISPLNTISTNLNR